MKGIVLAGGSGPARIFRSVFKTYLNDIYTSIVERMSTIRSSGKKDLVELNESVSNAHFTSLFQGGKYRKAISFIMMEASPVFKHITCFQFPDLKPDTNVPVEILSG